MESHGTSDRLLARLSRQNLHTRRIYFFKKILTVPSPSFFSTTPQLKLVPLVFTLGFLLLRLSAKHSLSFITSFGFFYHWTASRTIINPPLDDSSGFPHRRLTNIVLICVLFKGN